MSIRISAFLVQMMNTVPEADTELEKVDRYQHIKAAVVDYGRYKPDRQTADITGDGGKYYVINTTNFPGWNDGFSRVQSIEYPAATIASDEHPVYLEAEDWTEDYYDASSNRYLFLPNHAPPATETMRVTYNGLYTWSASTITIAVAKTSHGFSVDDYVYQDKDGNWVDANDVAGQLLATHKVTVVTDSDNFTIAELSVGVPDVDFFAICHKAACLACQALAERFSRTTDSTISADAVNHTSRSQEFANRAKDYCQMYANHLGIGSALSKPKGGSSADATMAKPASAFIDWDVEPAYPAGRRFLFRPGDRR